jgi:hypothetical protein
MKFDKELLLKHQFWIIFGGFGLIWLIGFFILVMGSASAVEEAKGNFDKANKEIEPYKANPAKIVNVNTFLDPWNQYATEFRKCKEAIWLKAWNGQKSLITWPHSETTDLKLDDIWNESHTFQEWKAKFLAEPASSEARIAYKETLYFDQFGKFDLRTGKPDPELEKLIEWYGNRKYEMVDRKRDTYGQRFEKLELALLVAPVEFQGSRNGFERIMVPAAGDGNEQGRGRGSRPSGPGIGVGEQNARTPKTLFTADPTMEEVWLAQEDFWVKREILRAIRKAINNLAVLYEVKLDAKEVKPGFFQHRRFKNDTWVIDLLFEKNNSGKNFVSSKGTIRNVDPVKRVLALANPYTRGGVEFLLRQGAVDYPLEIKGEPLAWDQVAEFNFAEPRPVDNLDPTKPFTMEQIFDWSTSPIRQIENIQVGAHSHRTCHVPLKPNPALLASAGPAGSPGVPVSGDKPAGTAPGSKPGGLAGKPAKGAATAAAASEPFTSPNQLSRNRYIYVTEQCRHTPIAILLVVEQEHIHDVLVSLTDSLLRFQVTQIHLSHAKGVVSELPVAVAKDPKGGDAASPGRSNQGSGQPTVVSPGASDLVELAIYGVAALYDRFPETSPAPSKEKDKPKGPAKEKPKDSPKGPLPPKGPPMDPKKP